MQDSSRVAQATSLAPAAAISHTVRLQRRLAECVGEILLRTGTVQETSLKRYNGLVERYNRFMGFSQPPLERFELSAEDYVLLIHPVGQGTALLTESTKSRDERQRIRRRIGSIARVMLGPALQHLSDCGICEGVLAGSGRTLTPKSICGLLPRAFDSARDDEGFLSAAFGHLESCSTGECTKIPISVLEAALQFRPMTIEYFGQITATMGDLRLWGPDAKRDYVGLLRSLSARCLELPAAEQHAAQFTLINLSFSLAKIGRVVRVHASSVGKAERTEADRISIHADRRFRWIYFLLLAVWGDGYEYRFVKATYQGGRGDLDNPACHSILGSLDRRYPAEEWWQLGRLGQTFESYSFYQVMQTTVSLPKWMNDMDCRMEDVLRQSMSRVLTQVARQEMLPDKGFLAFCAMYEKWARSNLSESTTAYLQPHLDYVDRYGGDPLLPLRSTGFSDSFFDDVVSAIRRRNPTLKPGNLVGSERERERWFRPLRDELFSVDTRDTEDLSSALPLPPLPQVTPPRVEGTPPRRRQMIIRRVPGATARDLSGPRSTPPGTPVGKSRRPKGRSRGKGS